MSVRLLFRMRYGASLGTSALLLSALLCSSACETAVLYAWRKRASYDYVTRAWGSISVGPLSATSSGVSIPIRLDGLYNRADSAICVAGGSARLDRDVLYLTLYKSLCRSGPSSELSILLNAVGSSTYEVRYDDAEAGYPVIGVVAQITGT